MSLELEVVKNRLFCQFKCLRAVSQEPGHQFRSHFDGVLVVASHHSNTKKCGPFVYGFGARPNLLGCSVGAKRSCVVQSAFTQEVRLGRWCCELPGRTAQFNGPRELGSCWGSREGKPRHQWSSGLQMQFNNVIVNRGCGFNK